MDVVFEFDFIGNNLKWNKFVFVLLLDGVVGGFVGISNDFFIFVGGVGFKGLRENYQNGKNYAYEGLKKLYSIDIYFWYNGKWDKLGELL